MTALMERTGYANVYNFDGDRFAAVSFIAQIRNELNTNFGTEMYKTEYLKRFRQACLDVMLSKKGIMNDNDDTKYMSSPSDIEGFEMAFNASFYNPFLIVEVYEKSTFETVFFLDIVDSESDFTEALVSKIANGTVSAEVETNQEYGFYHGHKTCSFPLRLDLNRLLSDIEREEIIEAAQAISQKSIFTI